MTNVTKITKLVTAMLTCCSLIISTPAQSLPTKVVGEAFDEKQEILKAKITRVEVSGNTVFSASEIEAIISNYPTPVLDFSDLLQLTRRLTNLYIENGYITSGAYLPQQKIVDGVAKIKIVEGKLERIEIKERKNLREKLIRSYFPLDLPLNINNLERQLRKLERNSSVRKVNGELVRGTGSSSSVLLLKIEEYPPFQTSLIFNNYRSPSIGEYQGIIAGSYSNLFGIGDRFLGQYNLTEGFDAYSLGFSLPLNSIDGLIEFEYREGDSQIIEGQFQEADIRAETDSIWLQYRQSIVESTTRDITVSIGFERRKEQTFLLDDVPFSFIDGAQEGRSATSAVSVTGVWTERGATSVLAISSQVSLGLDFWEATINDDAPDGRFIIFRGDVEWVKALNQERDLLFVFRLGTQLTPDSLLASQKLAIGGKGKVRGFRENEELGDNGVLGTVEMYIPLYKSLQNQTGLRLIPFVDWGITWESDRNDVNSLMSLGLGLSWEFSKRGKLRLDYGIPLIGENDDDSLQESGLSFSLEVKPF